MPSDPARLGESPDFAGRFSDGATAATASVRVSLSDRGVVISPVNEGEALVWPYGALASATPLAAGAEDVLLTYSYMPGATLFVADPAFARRLAHAAPGLSAGAERWRAARPWIVGFLGMSAIAAGVWLSGFSPAAAIAQQLPDGLRAKMGAQVVSSMSGQRRLCEAPDGRAALDALTARLSAASGSKSRFKVVVVDWGLLNAFAAPGEQIVLTRELVEKAAGPDEVAGVLAHEMGHGLELHPETGIVRALGLAAGLELLSGGGSGTLANIGLLLTQLSYTRAAEREADAHSLRMLKGAGISAKGIADFFRRVERLETRTGAGGPIGQIDILRTHPQSAERAKAAADQPSYPATPALEPKAWEALRTICKA